MRAVGAATSGPFQWNSSEPCKVHRVERGSGEGAPLAPFQLCILLKGGKGSTKGWGENPETPGGPEEYYCTHGCHLGDPCGDLNRNRVQLPVVGKAKSKDESTLVDFLLLAIHTKNAPTLKMSPLCILL